MNNVKKSKKRIALIFLPVFIFSLTIIVLGFTPHYTCGCGEQIQKGNKLTHFVNRVVGREIL